MTPALRPRCARAAHVLRRAARILNEHDVKLPGTIAGFHLNSNVPPSLPGEPGELVCVFIEQTADNVLSSPNEILAGAHSRVCSAARTGILENGAKHLHAGGLGAFHDALTGAFRAGLANLLQEAFAGAFTAHLYETERRKPFYSNTGRVFLAGFFQGAKHLPLMLKRA